MKSSIIRPMLACSTNILPKDLQSLQMPLYASIKQDGIRCRLDSTGRQTYPMSRSLKVLPNCHVQEWAAEHGIPGLDGEIVIPGWPFHDIQSWVMSDYGSPQPFEFRVFDFLSDKKFEDRIRQASRYGPEISRTYIVQQKFIETPNELLEFYNRTISEGEEGLILRSPTGLYKSGRSTLRQAYSLKMKFFDDDEAIITGWYPLKKNNNPSSPSELGLSKRSSHQANQEILPLLGGLKGFSRKNGNIKVGSGFTLDQRKEFYRIRHALKGREFTYKYQPHGSKDKPRTPIFKSLNP